jgi:hypothetical protein
LFTVNLVSAEDPQIDSLESSVSASLSTYACVVNARGTENCSLVDEMSVSEIISFTVATTAAVSA